ncbi:hypothetical protein Ccel01_20850 [Cellulosimicrobium cellulans]|nr:hypothetical protein Ccel01_20850 [Cellulosimicrobium cellulans]
MRASVARSCSDSRHRGGAGTPDPIDDGEPSNARAAASRRAAHDRRRLASHHEPVSRSDAAHGARPGRAERLLRRVWHARRVSETTTRDDVRVVVEDPTTPDVLALLQEHLDDMHATSPPESVHALDVERLRAPDITFVTARSADGGLLGCGALKQHDATLGELKSMRTTAAARGRGVAATVLAHLLDVARDRGLDRVSLETGTEDYFAAARRLYARHGFVPCAPFADYTDDPNSTYLTLSLA